jgi:hypothetical protein
MNSQTNPQQIDPKTILALTTLMNNQKNNDGKKDL